MFKRPRYVGHYGTCTCIYYNVMCCTCTCIMIYGLYAWFPAWKLLHTRQKSMSYMYSVSNTILCTCCNTIVYMCASWFSSGGLYMYMYMCSACAQCTCVHECLPLNKSVNLAYPIYVLSYMYQWSNVLLTQTIAPPTPATPTVFATPIPTPPTPSLPAGTQASTASRQPLQPKVSTYMLHNIIHVYIVIFWIDLYVHQCCRQLVF